MSGFSDRRFYMLEGFGYNSTAELRAVHPTYSGTTSIDTTTIPGRRCLNIASGGYHDITIPRYDGYPWSENASSSAYNVVVQAKLYLDVDSYTNLSVDSFLQEIWGGPDRKQGWGLSPNTSVAQDNWYMKATDFASDIAITNPFYTPPGIPPRTLVDVKFMYYSNGEDDGVFALAINNYVVAYTLYYGIYFWIGYNTRRFRGLRLHGLANQTGPTLWSDVMVYGVHNEFKHPFRQIVSDIYYFGTSSNFTLWDINGAPNYVPMSARVLDITPTSTDNAVNEFVTLGTGSPITALSGVDTNQYVTSSAPNQAFRLRVNQPDEATGDGSTPITITDTSEVLATHYRIFGKDLGGTASTVSMTMADDTNLTYQYRYYKLRMSEIYSNAAGGYLNKVQFLDSSLNRLAFPVGATMRLNNVNEFVAQEYRANNRASNTAEHTVCLTASPSTSIEHYYAHLEYCGYVAAYNRGNYADYILDMGVGNVGPNWYALQIYQPGYWDRNFTNFSVYGSSDGITWYLLGDSINTNNSNPDNPTVNITNRRHPSYTGGTVRSLVSFNLNNSQYEQLALTYTGDPMSGGNPLREPRTPIPWAQYKNYSIGFNEL